MVVFCICPSCWTKHVRKAWEGEFLPTQIQYVNFLPGLPHIQVWTWKQSREFFLFEEFAGKGNLKLGLLLKKQNKTVWMRQRKQWWKILASSCPPSFHPQENNNNKKYHWEYAAHSKRVKTSLCLAALQVYKERSQWSLHSHVLLLPMLLLLLWLHHY